MIVNFSRHPGVPGPHIPRLLVIFLGFFFNQLQSDRLTQHQETHSTLNEKEKGDGLSNLEKVLNFSGRLEKSLKFTTLSKPDTILCKLN